MVSLFRKALCYVIVAQMVLTPLYGVSAAAPVVMVSDTKAQGLLGTQVAKLALINGQLIALNLTQQETNTKLDQILAAIKYIPDPKIKDPFPTTDKVLIEFSSSLYAAYTSDSIAYTAMKEAAGVQAQTQEQRTRKANKATEEAQTEWEKQKKAQEEWNKQQKAANPSATPAATPATSGTPAPATQNPTQPSGSGNGSQPSGSPAGSNTPPSQPSSLNRPTPLGLDKSSLPPNYDFNAPSAPPLVSSTVPAGDFSGAFGPSTSINPILGYNLKDSLIAKPSDPLGDIANFTDMAVKLAGDSARTFYNFRNLQNCGNAINCASSGLNVATGVLGTLKNYGINIGDANFQKNLGYVGAAVSFANLVTDLFSGGFNVQKLLQFINGMQQNILFASIAKGGLLMGDTNESKTSRIIGNSAIFLGWGGLFALRDTNAVGWIVALNNFSQIGAATKDTPKSGSLSTDTPLAGTTNPANQAPTTAETAEFLRKLLECNREIAKTTAQCKQMEEANKRLFLGQLKSRCAAAAISKQQVPAKMFQELFTGTGNQKSCEKTTMYKTNNGKELCTSIALLQASSLAEGSVMSQMNVLIGLSMYNLVMTNVNTEQVILQNACASLGDLIESGAPVYQAND
jgi:hypothetical protein